MSQVEHQRLKRKKTAIVDRRLAAEKKSNIKGRAYA